MRSRFSPVWLIARRELRDHFRDWRILAPLLILMLIFPLLMKSFASSAVDFVNKYGADLVVERLVPFSVLIIGFFPVTVSLVIALESFVGEKERGTIEPLLTTPFLDWQLYVGKLLVGVSIPLLTSYLSIAFYLVLIRAQGMAMPPWTQILQILLLTLAHTVLMVSGAMVVSSRATTVRSANLLASFIILPMAFLLQLESAIFFWGNAVFLLWFVIFAAFVLAALLLRMGVAHFKREYLLGREIDTINLRRIGNTFWQAFRGDARTLKEWYQVEIPRTIRRLRIPIFLTTLLLLLTLGGSFLAVQKILPSMIQPGNAKAFQEKLVDSLAESMEIPEPGTLISFRTIFLHNLLSISVELIFGMMSFGLMGVLIFLVNIALVGGLLSAYQFFGYSAAAIFLRGILPHGIFELSALILSTAAVLYIGVMMVTPAPERTLGETFLAALADWVKVFLGLVLPLLLVAALVETYITPLLLFQFLQ